MLKFIANQKFILLKNPDGTGRNIKNHKIIHVKLILKVVTVFEVFDDAITYYQNFGIKMIALTFSFQPCATLEVNNMDRSDIMDEVNDLFDLVTIYIVR